LFGHGETGTVIWRSPEWTGVLVEGETMTDDSVQQKFELYLSAESEFLIDGMVRSGRFGSTSEAVLLAVELGVQKLAEDESIGFSSDDDE
jgi:hypothetical protein